MTLEIEAKFYLNHPLTLRTRAFELGAQTITHRRLLRNLRFDDHKHTLSSRHQVLRLRTENEARLTFKKPGSSAGERMEYEVTVADPVATQQILEALGYQVFACYETYRQTLQLGAVRLMLDELPFGHFLEIEADDTSAVHAATQRLQLNWENRIQRSYLTLFQELCRTNNWSDHNASFARFTNLPAVTAAKLGVRAADSQ